MLVAEARGINYAEQADALHLGHDAEAPVRAAGRDRPPRPCPRASPRRDTACSCSARRQASGTTRSPPGSPRSARSAPATGSRSMRRRTPRRSPTGGSRRYAAVVWLSTTGDVLDGAQQAAFRRYIRRGGGYAGVHAAADTEYGWGWYGRLLGARFLTAPRDPARDDPRRRPAAPLDPRAAAPLDPHRRVVRLPRAAAPRGARARAAATRSTYAGGSMGARHPIAWCRRFQGGRSWYTARRPHRGELRRAPRFRAHLLGGIRWAAGRG